METVRAPNSNIGWIWKASKRPNTRKILHPEIEEWLKDNKITYKVIDQYPNALIEFDSKSAAILYRLTW